MHRWYSEVVDSDDTQPDPAPSLRERQGALAREAILDALIDRIEAGEPDPSYVDLARESGVARRTLYRYFPTREALYAAAGVRVRERLRLPIEIDGPDDIVASFTATAATHGLPASTLTDNGSVYTSRFTHGHNDFERLLNSLGIRQKNGHPNHPQTQGKIERFHQTFKAWLIVRPRPTSIAELQTLLDTFTTLYNTERTHRALRAGTTPAQAYLARPKAHPTGQPSTHFRIRHDTVDQFGKLTLRHASQLRHLGIGRAHTGTPVLILVTTTTVTVISKTGHHVLSTHHIEPDKNYWPNQNKNPGPRPGNL